MRNQTLAAMCCLLMAMPASGDILYGLSSNHPSEGRLYTIDTTTGAATLVTPITGSTSKVGLEYLDGKMYASDVPNSFGTINLTSGAYTLIQDKPLGSYDWHGLAGDPSTGLLYATSQDPGTGANSLVSIDVKTYAMTPVGGMTPWIHGLAYDNERDVLYGVDSDELYTISTSTGTATLIGSLMLTGTDDTNHWLGLAYDHVNDTLFLNTLNTLFTVDTLTGKASIVGVNSTTDLRIDGLAFLPTVVPVPGAFLLGFLGLGYAGMRLRKGA